MHVNDICPSKQLLGIAIGLALCAPSALAGNPPAGDPGLMEATQRLLPFRAAKHVILFIGDGMNTKHEIATSRYLYGKDFALSFHDLPYRGNVATWDVTTYNKYAAQAGAASYDPAAIQPALGYDWRQGGKAPYPLDPVTSADIIEYFIPDDIAFGPTKPFATDSASAGTALATGIKTDDGNLAWLPGDPADGALTTVAETLRDERGFAIGVVSTVPFTHATPAAFVSHNVNRNNYHAIASEILAVVKPEVVIGGGYDVWQEFLRVEAVGQQALQFASDAAVQRPRLARDADRPTVACLEWAHTAGAGNTPSNSNWSRSNQRAPDTVL